MTVKQGWTGRFFEDFAVGDVYQHPLGRTITETDNTWFTLLTMNTSQMHFNDAVRGRSEFGRPLVVSTLTVAIAVGQSVTDLTQNAFANLGWDDIKLTAPGLRRRHALQRVRSSCDKRESTSRPHAGIVTVRDPHAQPGRARRCARSSARSTSTSAAPSSSRASSRRRGRCRWRLDTEEAGDEPAPDVPALGRDPRGARRRRRGAPRRPAPRCSGPPSCTAARRSPRRRSPRRRRRARVGTSIALAFTRSPMITALEALDLDELSGGRFVLGPRLRACSGSTRTGTTRASASRSPHLRETVRNVRLFWSSLRHRRARCASTASTSRCASAATNARSRCQRAAIPIYLAAMGPLMTRLAGEIADGWISHELCSPRLPRGAGPART